MRVAFAWLLLFLTAYPTSDVYAFACNNGYYINSSGHQVHSPSCGRPEEGHRSAVCRDGSISFSEHHRGTCSHHGGVARWE
jgi:hypothetical protein